MVSTPQSSQRPAWHALPVFRGVPDTALDALHRHMEEVQFEPGEDLVRQGDPGDFMYVLTSGRVSIMAETPLHDTMFEIALEAPCVVGETALITSEPRTATVRAEREVAGLRIAKEGLDEVLSEHRVVAQILTAIVGKRLLEADTITRVGQFQIVGRLGRGAMATVFEAEQPRLRRTVALKMLSHALAYNPTFIQRFENEAKLIASLDHGNIVRVHDTVQGYGTHFIVMERLTGSGLDEVIKESLDLGWDGVRRVLIEVLRALHFAHERDLLHRDIKPSNVFLSADGRVKLLDFGIAVHADESETRGGRMAGTPYYMAPEQILGERLDGRADLYSTGILAYQLVSGRVPFDALELDDLWRLHLRKPVPDLHTLVEGIPEDLVQFVERATAKKREDRFASCGEAADFLEPGIHAQVVEALEQSCVSIAYDPACREDVAAAVLALEQALQKLPGVVVHASRSTK